MKVTVYADRGAVTALSLPGEATNFNGLPVTEVEFEEGGLEAALEAAGLSSGVGTPWPLVKPKTAKGAK